MLPRPLQTRGRKIERAGYGEMSGKRNALPLQLESLPHEMRRNYGRRLFHCHERFGAYHSSAPTRGEEMPDASPDLHQD
jgi:hypothetical protein